MVGLSTSPGGVQATAFLPGQLQLRALQQPAFCPQKAEQTHMHKKHRSKQEPSLEKSGAGGWVALLSSRHKI